MAKPKYCDSSDFETIGRLNGECANFEGGHCTLLDVDLKLKVPESWADIRELNWGFIPACQVKARRSRKVTVKRIIAENDGHTLSRLEQFRDLMR